MVEYIKEEYWLSVSLNPMSRILQNEYIFRRKQDICSTDKPSVSWASTGFEPNGGRSTLHALTLEVDDFRTIIHHQQ
jgi:hypothetical protein